MSTTIIRSGCGCVAQIHTGEQRKRAGYSFEFDYCPPHLHGPALLKAARALWDKDVMEGGEYSTVGEWCDLIEAIEAAEAPATEPLKSASETTPNHQPTPSTPAPHPKEVA